MEVLLVVSSSASHDRESAVFREVCRDCRVMLTFPSDLTHLRPARSVSLTTSPKDLPLSPVPGHRIATVLTGEGRSVITIVDYRVRREVKLSFPSDIAL